MRFSKQSIFLGCCLSLCVLLAAYMIFEAVASSPAVPNVGFNGDRAYGYLKKICDFGPRPSGTEAMRKQRDYLVDFFEAAGGQVELQKFQAKNPESGKLVELANVVVTWHPDRSERIVLGAHYDTRPFPDRDPVNPRGVFIGANDGASGVAVLMELAHEMPGLQGKLGVDFVLFDGEELVYSERDPYFLGSEHFARTYKKIKPPYRYKWGVVLDMVADADLAIPYEGHVRIFHETKPLARSIWSTARKLRVKEFLEAEGREVRDDHLALNNIAGIPTCNVIDFSYPPWHTTNDTPEQCSADSLGKVGSVILEWLRTTSARGTLR